MSSHTSSIPAVNSRDKNVECIVPDRDVYMTGQGDQREHNEEGYRLAREAVRANDGIKILLHFLQPGISLPPAALDCLRALACWVLLGLAKDDTIAHILATLQVYFMSFC